MKEYIFIDSGSTVKATVNNPEFMTDIRVSKNPVDLNTNGGKSQLNVEGNIPGFCNNHDAWLDVNHLANLLGFSHMADEYHIEYNNKKEDAFLVHTPYGTCKFVRMGRLYGYKPSKDFLNKVAQAKGLQQHGQSVHALPFDTDDSKEFMVSTVKENMMGYTSRQIEDAKAARALYHNCGTPTVDSFKSILRQKIIKNCSVTTEDVNIALKIFGPDLGALKGKTTRRNIVQRVKDDLVEIPKELTIQFDNLILHFDIMYVNGLPFLTGIDRPIRYRSTVPLSSRTKDELYRALDVLLRFYNKAGCRIKGIQCDGEFKPLMERVEDDLEVSMNYTSAGEHESISERNNRTIGERVRCGYYNQPYRTMPKLMLIWLVMVATCQLNYFPVKGGVSAYYSPLVILGKTDLQYEDLKIPFGAYVQAFHESTPKNTNAPRTLDCIHLRATQNKQRGYELMDLNTGKLITRPRVWQMPATQLVIQRVEELGDKDGIKSLKLTNRNKTVIYPSHWFEGVEYSSNTNKKKKQKENKKQHLNEPMEENNSFSDESDDDYSSASSEDSDFDYDSDTSENELDDITAEKESSLKPTTVDGDDPVQDTQQNNADQDTQQNNPDPEPQQRSARSRQPRSVMNISKNAGQSYDQGHQVKFQNQSWEELEQCHNIMADTSGIPEMDLEYSAEFAMLLGRYIVDFNSRAKSNNFSFGQQYILQKGLKVFGKRAYDSTKDEIKQLHFRNAFEPEDISNLTAEEKKKALDTLIFVTEKRTGEIKSRACINGKPSRQYINREDTASPTAAQESIFLLATVDAHEGRDVMTTDIPNAFIQTELNQVKDGEARVIMKVTGVVVDILVELAPQTYAKFVVFENGKKTLYLVVVKAIYGLLVSSLLWYKAMRSDLEKIGFIYNPYDPCVANAMVNGNQHTVRYHVDDLMCSHMDPKVNTNFLQWLNKMYGKYKEVTGIRGPKHDYLGMHFDFSTPGEVHIDMIDYVTSMIEDFSVKLSKTDTRKSPAADDLFDIGNGQKIPKELAEEFHTFVAKGLFACKRARPDIHTAISVLCTRVQNPTEEDWRKLIDVLKFLNGTRTDKLKLSIEDLSIIKWFVDASFAVHPDFKSHTGGMMTMGKGAIISQSRKQKLNTKSSTEAEVVAVDDISTMILWTKLFMEAQGYNIKRNVLLQDNKSAMLLEQNGKSSSSKRTRAMNIRFFFITDQIQKGNVEVVYCPTEEMLGDINTKPKQGKQFEFLRRHMMGHN